MTVPWLIFCSFVANCGSLKLSSYTQHTNTYCICRKGQQCWRISSWFTCQINLNLFRFTFDKIINSIQSASLFLREKKLEKWANAQRDGRPGEYRWRPLFNAAKFGWRPLLECRALTLPRLETRWNLQGCPKLENRSQPIIGRSSPYYQSMWRRYYCLTRFFLIVDTRLPKI